MKIIGLAGGSGTGKGTVAAIFEKYNITSIDADAVYHELTSVSGTPCLLALKEAFGESVITDDGILDRKALAKTVFADGAAEKRKKLNEITHTFVLDEIRRRIKALSEFSYDAVLIDAPLLFESGFDKECDIILCVISEKNARIRRITERDGISEEMASARIASQLGDEALIASSDIVIRNDGNLTELEREVEIALEKIKKYKKEI